MADTTDPLALAEPSKRRLRKRTISVDRDEVIERILGQVSDAIDERAEWNDKRLERYAKLRGWTAREHPPWDDASNTHVPVMMANCLRVKAGLFNAVLGIRPVMTPKTINRMHRERAEKANHLIDYQVFMEADGEKRIDSFIASFVDEGTAVSFQAWSREKKKRYDVRVLPYPKDRALIEYMAEQIQAVILPNGQDVIAKDEDGYEWSAVVMTPDGDRVDVEIKVYDKDEDRIEVCLAWEGIAFDGPTITVHDLTDIVVPMRSENAQPISPRNPFGAPWIARLVRVHLDHIRRKRKDGTYDLLTDEDMDVIEGLAEGRIPKHIEDDEQKLKDYKDQMAGLQAKYGDDPEDRQWMTMVEWYGADDLDGDGFDEEVIYWGLREAKILCRARHLTEIHPGEPECRPFADERLIPVEGEFYGIGLPELMEGLHDLLHVLFNQNIDRGDLANQPFFFYRASSGLKPDIIRMWPGDGFPLDNPATDVMFPQMPHADQTWSFNMIGLTMQFLERLTQMGAMQFGQVPQGKASALRTLGTTMAILQQGAALPEQILRRLFKGLSTIWQQIHQLNTKFLPKKKEYLIAGKGAKDDDAYDTVVDPSEIAVAIAFDFEATLLNTNKGLVSQALMGIGQAIFNPLAFQVGVVTPEEFYNWAKDLIQANQLDYQRYLKKPVNMPEGPRMTFEEALLVILSNHLPEVAPLEPLEQYQQKMMSFMQSDQFGILTDGQVILFNEHLKAVVGALRAQLQQQMLAGAAGQFTAMLGNKGQGQGGAPSMGTPPEMQTEQGSQDELQGAMGMMGG